MKSIHSRTSVCRRTGTAPARRGRVGRGTVVFLAMVGLVAYLTAGGGFRQVANWWSGDSDRPTWEVFTAQSEPLQDILLDASGHAAPPQRVEIAPQAQGILKIVNVDEGDRVLPGQLLAAIDATTYEADLASAQASLRAAKARLAELRNGASEADVNLARLNVKQAKLSFDHARQQRTQAEAARRAVTDQEFETLVAAETEAEKQLQNLELQLQLVEKGAREEQIAAAAAEVQRAEAAVTRAEHFLRNTRLISPVPAIVLERNGDVGEVVLPNITALVLANDSSMEVLIDVPERDLYLIEIGRPARIITDAYPDREYAGSISLIEPHVERSRGVVQVRVRVNDPDEFLLPNMNCRVLCLHDESATSADQVWVPSAAIEKIDDEMAVYVLEQGLARRRVVKSSGSAPGAIRISEGLAAGEQVVLPGVGTLKDGLAIEVRKSVMADAEANDSDV